MAIRLTFPGGYTCSNLRHSSRSICRVGNDAQRSHWCITEPGFARVQFTLLVLPDEDRVFVVGEDTRTPTYVNRTLVRNGRLEELKNIGQDKLRIGSIEITFIYSNELGIDTWNAVLR